MPKTPPGTKAARKSAGRSRSKDAEKAPPDLAGAVKDSAQSIWLAGLGALSKAQTEGGKFFDALVKEGHHVQRKAQGAAQERLGEVTESKRETALDLTHRAEREWGRLEQMFEERLAQALHRMGMPSTRELHTLQARVRDLETQLKAVEKTPPKRAGTVRSKATTAAPRRRPKSPGTTEGSA